ncbi:MAG TPA: hypothetical protein VMV56_07480 [Williamwhitmania sp.]|nr:hypothetical protein [Williamwhitmania sp.]
MAICKECKLPLPAGMRSDAERHPACKTIYHNRIKKQRQANLPKEKLLESETNYQAWLLNNKDAIQKIRVITFMLIKVFNLTRVEIQAPLCILRNNGYHFSNSWYRFIKRDLIKLDSRLEKYFRGKGEK